MATEAPIVIAAARPFRSATGGFHNSNAFRDALARTRATPASTSSG
jgi:hypothetical protein